MNLPPTTYQTFIFLKKKPEAPDFANKNVPQKKNIQPPNESAPIKSATPRCSKNPINADPKAYIDEIVESYAGPRWVAHNGASAAMQIFWRTKIKSLKGNWFCLWYKREIFDEEMVGGWKSIILSFDPI